MWTRAAPLVLSVSRLTSASSTTRRLCAGNLATVRSVRELPEHSFAVLTKAVLKQQTPTSSVSEPGQNLLLSALPGLNLTLR